MPYRGLIDAGSMPKVVTSVREESPYTDESYHSSWTRYRTFNHTIYFPSRVKGFDLIGRMDTLYEKRAPYFYYREEDLDWVRESRTMKLMIETPDLIMDIRSDEYETFKQFVGFSLDIYYAHITGYITFPREMRIDPPSGRVKLKYKLYSTEVQGYNLCIDPNFPEHDD